METKLLKKLCTTISSIIKNDKIRPITDFVEIYAKDGMFHIGSTDNRTTITASIEDENDLDNAVISLSSLSSIVKLTTTEDVKLTNKGKYVEFSGNGKYKIPIQTDELGNKLYLPLEMPSIEECGYCTYNIDDWKLAVERNKIALFSGEGHENFKSYYNHKGNLVSTDSIILANTYNINLPVGSLPDFVVNQLANLNQEMDFYIVDDGYIVISDVFKIYFVTKNREKFPIDLVIPFLSNIPMDSQSSFFIKFKPDNFIETIKRQKVFKNSYDVPSIILFIDEQGIVHVKNKEETVDEVIATTKFTGEYSIKVQTEIILSVLRIMEKEVTVYVGNNMIGLEDTKGFYIIAGIEET